MANGNDLPTDRLYQYNPKPPVAQLPHIEAHLFETALNACGRSCALSFLHDCGEPFEGTFFLDKIPKRAVALQLNTKGEVDAWGLKAEHRISFVYIVCYLVIAVTATFGFWAWWLKRHPGDLQNAAIPLTTITILLSLVLNTAGFSRTRAKENE